MEAISSSAFLREFTLYAEQAAAKDETYIIQRSNGKNMVFMSLDKYNEINKELFLLKNGNDK